MTPTQHAPAAQTQRRPRSAWSSMTNSCVTAIACSASQAKSVASSAGEASFQIFQIEK